jgi:hypothetical protein
MLIRKLLPVIVVVCAVSATSLPGLAQGSGSSSPLLRIQRQTYDQDVCMLVRNDGQFHMERLAPGMGQSRVYEGTLPEAAMSDLQKILNTDDMKSLTQAKIQMALVGEDRDQLLFAIDRDGSWQSLHFTSGASRKPFKNAVDPLVKWLDRYKQQNNALANGVTNRCMPPAESTTTTTAAAATAQAPKNLQQSSQNPYMLRIVTDHFETTTNDSASIVKGTMENGTDVKVTRVCMVIYDSGRYRMEKSKQMYNAPLQSQVYLDSLSDGQIKELRGILDAPEISKLQHATSAGAGGAREGETVNMAVPRGSTTQVLSFASLFGVRTQQAGMKDNLSTGVDEELNNIKSLRKWLKSNVEDKKVPQAKDAASTSCIPSQQPE